MIAVDRLPIPTEFVQFCQSVYWPPSQPNPGTRRLISDALGAVDDAGRVVLKDFINKLLSDGYSDEELRQIWMKPHPTWGFRLGGHRPFLSLVRDIIDEQADNVAYPSRGEG